MGYDKFLSDMIDSKILDISTAYLAKVISVSGKTAKIQPLGMVKEVGENAQKQSPLSAVPIATQKFVNSSVEVVSNVTLSTSKNSDGAITSASLNVSKKTLKISEAKPIEANDIVVCICCDRDITEAKKGKNAVPAIGHHSKSDSIIIGVL